MGKLKPIESFFKKSDDTQLGQNLDPSTPIEHAPKRQGIQPTDMDASSLERDPGLRPPIWEFPSNQRDEIRCAYFKVGPYQPKLKNYPLLGPESHRRRFQSSWFEAYLTWLEYSIEKNAIYCLPCYLFGKQPTGRSGSDAFTIKGFDNWKKVNEGMNCPLLCHVGNEPNSPYNIAVKNCEDLMKKEQYIDKVVQRQTLKEIQNNRLRLKTSVDCIRWLTFQACAFRGHDERPNSKNRGNFVELIKMLASYNEKVADVVLENAPKNAKYTSHDIQKEILHVFASKVRKTIREEMGDAKFCIIVDEAQDESKMEQMAIVLRFVNRDGFIQERFFDIVHVKDTAALTLKKEIDSVLSRHDLNIENLRGQGYDDASNMRGEWNGLQALFLNECPYAYYVHCLAHRLQLALVAASREIAFIHQFFSKLTSIVNIICASPKRKDDLMSTQATLVERLIVIGELETGRGANQIGTLQRPGDT